MSDDTQNLLKETIAILTFYDKEPADVQWVGSRGGHYAVSWNTFAVMADFEYNYGRGKVEINPDLVVVGADWWLERDEFRGGLCEGCEEWVFKKLPKLHNSTQKMIRIRNE